MTDHEKNAILNNVQRQYIGARYVPKFFQGPDGTPTWLENVPYEALTIVTYLGNSYTSKVPVPAGIGNPSQNPTYWALTGNYNAQVEGYRVEVENVKADVTTLQVQYRDIVNTVNSQGQSINDLKSLKSNKKRVALYIGNSYTVGTGSQSGGNGIYEKTKKIWDFSKMYWASSVGFAAYSNITQTFLGLLTNAFTDPEIDNESVTDILVISAWGDSRTIISELGAGITKIKNQMGAFAQYAKTNFPNATIHLFLAESKGTPTIAVDNSPYRGTFYAHKFFSINAEKYGMQYHGWIGWKILGSSYFASDNYHPNDDGYDILATSLYNALKGNLQYGVLTQTFSMKMGTLILYVDISVDPSNIYITPLYTTGSAQPGSYTLDITGMAQPYIYTTSTDAQPIVSFIMVNNSTARIDIKIKQTSGASQFVVVVTGECSSPASVIGGLCNNGAFQAFIN